MPQPAWVAAAALVGLLSGCVSTDGGNPAEPPILSQPAFAQIKSAPDTYKGQAVTFGGQVLSARRLKEGTRLEILQLPLAAKQPVPDLRKSEGRFVAMHREFLDPATIPAGTLVTVAGDVSGSVVLPLDETDYNYPVVEIRELRVWQAQVDQPVRIRPYMGPGPYWGPYWSPYWRPYPYW